MTRSIINPATGLKRRQLHREVNRHERSKCLTVQQRRTLMEIKKRIGESTKATQMGATFMITAGIALQQILNHTGGTETAFSRALLDLMCIIYRQMVISQISYHYYVGLDASIAEIPLIEDRQPKYYQAPTITRICHFQNDDKARNMTRFTRPQLCRLLLAFDLPGKISNLPPATLLLRCHPCHHGRRYPWWSIWSKYYWIQVASLIFRYEVLPFDWSTRTRDVGSTICSLRRTDSEEDCRVQTLVQ
jgi:hypothetical protein